MSVDGAPEAADEVVAVGVVVFTGSGFAAIGAALVCVVPKAMVSVLAVFTAVVGCTGAGMGAVAAR